MVAVLFPVTSAPGARPQESAGRLVNAYAVKTEQGAPTPLRWTRTSGLRELMTVAGQAGFRVTSPTTAIFPRRWGRQVLNSRARQRRYFHLCGPTWQPSNLMTPRC